MDATGSNLPLDMAAMTLESQLLAQGWVRDDFMIGIARTVDVIHVYAFTKMKNRPPTEWQGHKVSAKRVGRPSTKLLGRSRRR